MSTLRIGVNGGGGHAHIDSAIEQARGAHEDGFPTYWLSQVFGVDSLTTLALIAREVPEIELGVAVVPTYPRHPVALAIQAQTVQQAAEGRFVLGIGPSHAPAVEAMWGLDWSRPYSHTAEYLAIVRDLLDGKTLQHLGEQLTTRGQLTATAARTPILVAGLGPRMLALWPARRPTAPPPGCAGSTTLESLHRPSAYARRRTAPGARHRGSSRACPCA